MRYQQLQSGTVKRGLGLDPWILSEGYVRVLWIIEILTRGWWILQGAMDPYKGMHDVDPYRGLWIL